jgi:shikimate kinase
MSHNIVLIGMPGAGKSTVGVLVAKTLGMSFVDTDLLIQEKEGRLLQEIIDQDGVVAFLKIEEGVILQVNVTNGVIATGGSVIYSRAAIQHLKTNGTLIYLKLRYDEIEQRIHNMGSRGIAIGKRQNLRDLFHERVILYEQHTDITIDCSNVTIEDVVQKVTNVVTGQIKRCGESLCL